MATERWLWAGLAITLYVWMCLYIVWQQRRKQRHAAVAAANLLPSVNQQHHWLVVYASQTGNAEQHAWHTARALQLGGLAAKVLNLGQLTRSELQQAERVLIIASTYGEGDPPDNAVPFATQVMNESTSLTNLHYGLLALGDRTYKNFCGFARHLDQWLQSVGAQPLFTRIEVSNDDAVALNQWRHELSHLIGTDDVPDWQAPSFATWRLLARTQLNQGSAGLPTFQVDLEPVDEPLPAWQAGDLVQVQVPADPSRAREYSIASLPSEGRLQLLIRQERRADGSLGLASGWLTESAALGTQVPLRIRPHHNFRIGDNAERDLILIGNGTGLAGLRAHLKARQLQQPRTHAPRNWLIFGERNARFDRYYVDDLTQWQQSGVLTRVDLVYSRDQVERRYVQHCITEHATEIQSWLNQGAAIYVCGSLQGMAGGVHTALVNILGETALQQLVAAGRYRRDVY